MKLLLALLAPFLAFVLAGCMAGDAPPEDARVIDIEMSRYQFAPGTDAPVNISKGETVILRLTSTDVTHGFKILEYGIDVEVPPGQTIDVELRATKEGDFLIFCTVFCGAGHPEHKGTLHVA